jgi:hypothetical protein
VILHCSLGTNSLIFNHRHAGKAEVAMIGREYFVRQAATLLRMARTVKDPALSAKLLSKAATYEEKAEDGRATSAPRRRVVRGGLETKIDEGNCARFRCGL